MADRFAGAEFAGLAPDLDPGKWTRCPEEVGKLMMRPRIEEVARDLGHAIACVNSGLKVGTGGFCRRGAVTLFAASRNPGVGACAVFYGVHPKVQHDLDVLQAPGLGIPGGHDAGTPPAAAAESNRLLTAAVKRHESHTYASAQHVFNDQRPEVYDASAAADARARMLAFFHRELKA